MAWIPASLLKTHRRLLTCETTRRVRFVYERRRYATMVKVRHGLATFTLKCGYSSSWLERAEHFETKIEQIW